MLGCLAPVIGAEDSRVGPADESVGIGTAKRALEAVKATSAVPVNAGTRALPAFDLPTLNSATPELSLHPTVDPTRRNDPSARRPIWVVPEEARRDQRPAAVGDLKDSMVREEGSRDYSKPEVGRDQRGPTRGADREENAGDVRAAKANNPLQPFLASWISRQDHNLLGAVPQLAGAATVFTGGTGEGENGFPAGLVALGGARIPAGESAVPRVAESTPARRADNPYLEGIGGSAPTIAPTVVLPPAVFAPVTPMPPTGIDSTRHESVVTPSRVPDFVRSTADDKYFKPLKRF